MSKEVIRLWNEIREDVLKYLRDKEFCSVIAHGSFTEGFANKTSDFDLLVICKEKAEEGTEVITVGDIEIDIDFLHGSTLEKQLESLDELLTPEAILPFATRLKNAVILFDRGGVGKNLLEKAKQFHPSDSLMDRYSKVGLSYYYDAVGAMASGDYATSVHMARLGALHVFRGIMLKHGETYARNKWLVKLANKKSFVFREILLRLMGLDSADEKQARECIRDLNQLMSEFQRLRGSKGN